MQQEGDIASIGIKSGYSEAELADSRRQYKWEKGQIDYLGEASLNTLKHKPTSTDSFVLFSGIDAFDNIQRQLDSVLGINTTSAPAAAQEPEAPAATNGVASDTAAAAAAAGAAAGPPKSILKST